MPRARSFRLSLIFVFAAVSTPAAAKTLDTWIAPIFSGNFPVHDLEDSFNGIDANPRIGFRFESGLMADNISLDFRASVLSFYTDYALVFRYFYCFGQGNTTLLCPGMGVGGGFSPGFVGATPRKFFDLIVNPYLRLIFDTQEDIAFFVEAGVLAIPTRNYSTGSPTVDKRAKIRPELAIGLMLNFDTVQNSLLDSSGGSSAAAEDKVFRFGLRGGIANSKIVGENIDTKFKAGLVGGVGLQLFTAPLNVGLDILYANRRLDVPGFGVFAADQLEFPLILKYRTPGANFLNIGTGSYFIKSLENGGGSDYGIATMVGIGVASRLVTLEFDLRLNFGLKESSGETRGQTWDLLVGFMF